LLLPETELAATAAAEFPATEVNARARTIAVDALSFIAFSL
jgi:hypothetical protein